MKEAQIKEAQKIMKHNKVEKLYLTSDGQFFLDENPAKNHSIKEHGNSRKKALKVTTVTEAMLVKTTKETDKQ